MLSIYAILLPENKLSISALFRLLDSYPRSARRFYCHSKAWVRRTRWRARSLSLFLRMSIHNIRAPRFLRARVFSFSRSRREPLHWSGERHGPCVPNASVCLCVNLWKGGKTTGKNASREVEFQLAYKRVKRSVLLFHYVLVLFFSVFIQFFSQSKSISEKIHMKEKNWKWGQSLGVDSNCQKS